MRIKAIRGIAAGFLCLVMLLTTGHNETAYACSCYIPSTAEEALASSGVVFAGTAKQVKPQRLQEGIVGPIEYRDVNLFEVESAWKGVDQSQIIVYDAGHDVSCGFVFEPGKSYLVYAYENDDGDLYTSYCNRTAELSAAEADLLRLGQSLEIKEQVHLELRMLWIANRDYDVELIIGFAGLMALAGWMAYRNRRK